MIILAIGGAVIKTAYEEIKKLAKRRAFDMLIHNGGSLFHDFQRATEKLDSHSYSLDEIYEDLNKLKPASILVEKWIKAWEAPKGSLTYICQRKEIEVLMFTALGTDFWQLFAPDWERVAFNSWFSFQHLKTAMEKPFHYICMGSAVIHPEVFTKALNVVKPKKFRADVVDFMEMYRPRSRVAKYGHYWKCTHKQYLQMWLKSGKVPVSSLKEPANDYQE